MEESKFEVNQTQISKKTTNTVQLEKIILYVALGIGAIASLFPFYWMFISATHSSGEIFSFPPKLLPGDNLITNIVNLNQQIGLGRVIFNSLFVTITFTIGNIIISSMAGYAFAKFKFKGRDILFFIVLITLMLPPQAKLIPLFDMMAKLDWVNSYKAVILPNLAYAFGIFLMRQNMLKVPTDLIDAARIDGCGEFKIFWKVVLPTMRPALAALGIYMFMFQWSRFMWPLVVLSSAKMKTIPVALSGLMGLSRIDYGQILVGASISTLPILITFLLLQKQFISGILSGSVKG
ncbi:ABC-type sugar transport system, permease component [Halobacteroides halobius DSM 5150]|uniref:ABC-type sugar transport system, permease component n=1 Tax=Halobacteroides halobius (strain ATCC 35273 / DSM 5150 / MD-1) TaxID=748449 RepID=L0K7L1_HALHC|nr:carbohydrate ABC transporter permease [Halobacteroides halobius]AGB41272.1 ABC-type sugar transport system, permease component [Halobacteroides halobius DSM 5150]